MTRPQLVPPVALIFARAFQGIDIVIERITAAWVGIDLLAKAGLSILLGLFHAAAIL